MKLLNGRNCSSPFSATRSRTLTIVRISLVCFAILNSFSCKDLLTAGFPDQSYLRWGDTVYVTLAGDGDVVYFNLPDTSLQAATVFLQALESGPGTVHMSGKYYETYEGFVNPWVSHRSDAPDTALFDFGSRNFRISEGQYIRLFFTSKGYAGEFRFVPWAVNFRPEQGTRQIEIGSMVSEEVFPPGDIDRFDFSSSGGEFVTVLTDNGGSIENQLTVSIRSFSDSAVVVGAIRDIGLGARKARISARSLPAGDYWFEVRGMNGQSSSSPFTLELVGVNPAPEVASAIVAPGDTVGESIGSVGDIDRYQPNVDLLKKYRVFFQNLSSSSGDSLALMISELFGGGTAIVISVPGETDLRRRSSGLVQFAAGSKIEVSGHSRTQDTGDYRFEVVLVDDGAPEDNLPTLVPGDSVRESVRAEGDSDVFQIQGSEG
ncbi:MAG: hypothetical protein OEZ54_10245, partial [Gemmatimonadota bacterium]|nr:hypothetical protein [Gemmatimonadota bacterium]